MPFIRVLISTLVVCLFLATLPAAAADPGPPLLFGGVGATPGHLVFDHADRIWRVPRSGGVAEPLTADGIEAHLPVVSPDGRWIAVTQEIAGNFDLYLLPADAAAPAEGAKRLTFHPKADFPRAFSADGRWLYFVSGRDSDMVLTPYRIAVDGVFPERVQLPVAHEMSPSPDGRRLAYNPYAYPFYPGAGYRFYRGGRSSELWLVDLATSEVEVLAGAEANHRYPLWLGDTLYYLSDATGSYNLYARRPAEGAIGGERRLTSYVDFPVLRLGFGSGGEGGGPVLVYAQEGRLHLYDPADGSDRVVPVTVPEPEGGWPERQPRQVAAGRFLQGVSLSADGRRLAVAARGDVLLVELPSSGEAAAASGSDAEGDAEEEAAPPPFERLTATSGAVERQPVFSPSGDRVAYFSDASGEYRLHVRRLADGVGGEAAREIPVQKTTVEEKPSFYSDPVWSPDGGKIAFSSRRLELWVADLATGTARRIDRSDYLAQQGWQPSWSPGGRYLAYSKGFPTHQRAIFIHDTESGESHRISGTEHATSPVFDANGRHLHYIASDLAGLMAGNVIWGQLSSILLGSLAHAQVVSVLLRADEQPPLGRLNGALNPAAAPPWVVADGPLAIAFEGIERRIVRLPLKPRDYRGLAAGGPGALFITYKAWSETPGSNDDGEIELASFRIGSGDGWRELAEEVDEVAVSGDGSTLLVETDGGLALLAAADAVAPVPDPDAEGGDDKAAAEESPPASRPLDLAGIEIAVEPAAEWRQMYREAWRMMREYFYDPGYHGQDLAALEEHYHAYLPGIARRADLNELFQLMLGNVSVSHMSIRGGDVPRGRGGPPERTATLGAEFELDPAAGPAGRYRISRIYRSGPVGHPSALVRAAPLDQPGVGVAEGEYLLAVDGEEIDGRKNLFAYLAGKAWGPLTLTVGPDPDFDLAHDPAHDPAGANAAGARQVTVQTVGGDNSIKSYNLYADAARRTEKLSGGRLAYIAMPDYGPGSIMSFLRDFVAQADRDGVIIDQRFGPGGITSDFLVQLLTNRRLHSYDFPYGEDLTVPLQRIGGPKVTLINERNSSASETFPLMFQIAGAGTLVGKRTMGAGVGGALGYPTLLDGGRITIPNRASYNPDTGEWAENVGVAPDVEVEWWPADWRAGRDTQLERAVAIALEQIDAGAGDRPVVRPEYPVHPR